MAMAPLVSCSQTQPTCTTNEGSGDVGIYTPVYNCPGIVSLYTTMVIELLCVINGDGN